MTRDAPATGGSGDGKSDWLKEILGEEDSKNQSRWRIVYLGVVVYTILLIVALYYLSVFTNEAAS